MPAYKAEPYIERAIQSVLTQSLTHWELIVVDDCSPDNTAAIVSRYLSDPRVRLIRHPQNRGECGARNTALEAAQGEWIALLDADDWYAPNRLERMLWYASETGEKVIHDVLWGVEEETGASYLLRLSDVVEVPAQVKRLTKYEYAWAHVGGQPLMSHEVIQKYQLRYPLDIVRGGDFIFQCRVVVRSGSTILIPEPLYYYRLYSESMLSQARRNWRRNVDLIQTKFRALLSVPEIREDAKLQRILRKTGRRLLRNELYESFASALKAGRWREAVAMIMISPELVSMILKRQVNKRLGKDA